MADAAARQLQYEYKAVSMNLQIFTDIRMKTFINKPKNFLMKKLISSTRTQTWFYKRM